MQYDFVILGGTGLQGKIVARDLLEKGYRVLLCGRNKSRVLFLLQHFKKSSFVYLDLQDFEQIFTTIKQSKAKVIINCAEGDWNLQVLRACIRAGAHSLDLGSEIWMTKKQFALHETLRRKGLTHITGCGSVPGIGNVMLRHAAPQFDTISCIDVGFAWNSNKKIFVVPFSMESIIEEFTDPSNPVHRGHFLKIFPMSSLRNHRDRYVGEQRKFLVRHPETFTFYHYFKKQGVKDIRFYAEFPLHSFDVISQLIRLGFGSKKEIVVDGHPVKPVHVVSEVLKNLPIPPGYKEKEDLWVIIKGRKHGKKKKIRMNCVVPTLKGWEDAGCNIDTGIPMSIMAEMIYRHIITERGSFAPEAVVPPLPFFEELRKKSMMVYQDGKRLDIRCSFV